MEPQPPFLLIHEYVTGGGWAEDPLPPGLAAEGLAMLTAALADFSRWGRFPLLTTLDARLENVEIPAAEVVRVDSGRYWEALPDLLRRCAAALVIAPEGDGALARLSALVEGEGCLLLGSRPAAVAAAGDKWECYRRFVRAGLPTPHTELVTPSTAGRRARHLGFPLVAKPRDGAGSEGVALLEDSEELEAFMAEPPSVIDPARGLLLQAYVPGVHASVSLLAAGGDSRVLSLNRQLVEVEGSFRCRGCRPGLLHEFGGEACAAARAAVALVPGLRGYVGVDVVLNEAGCHLIEVNPRLTTSYVELRRRFEEGLASFIWGTCAAGSLPDPGQLGWGESGEGEWSPRGGGG